MRLDVDDFYIYEQWKDMPIRSDVAIEGDMLFSVYAMLIESDMRDEVPLTNIVEVVITSQDLEDDVLITYFDSEGKSFKVNCYTGFHGGTPVLMLGGE